MERKKDLRVVKTKRALVSALFSLLKSTPFTKITVNDICTEALVSRSAFYTHFLDKYDLVLYGLNRLHEQLFEQSETRSVQEQLRHTLQQVHQDSRMFANLLLAEYDGELMALLRKGFIEHLERRAHSATLPQPKNISALFYAAGLAGAILQWVSTGMTYTVEEMAACLGALLPEDTRIT
ncbi:MAG: TetR-like C-terminal domain-containing protein [Christensenellales bacterium]|jgi:AcrR family transcriptional regulator